MFIHIGHYSFFMPLKQLHDWNSRFKAVSAGQSRVLTWNLSTAEVITKIKNAVMDSVDFDFGVYQFHLTFTFWVSVQIREVLKVSHCLHTTLLICLLNLWEEYIVPDKMGPLCEWQSLKKVVEMKQSMKAFSKCIILQNPFNIDSELVGNNHSKTKQIQEIHLEDYCVDAGCIGCIK